jgi:hypothetical protein
MENFNLTVSHNYVQQRAIANKLISIKYINLSFN